MRQFIARTITGPIDPGALFAELWPRPHLNRMLMCSVIIHLCLATSLIVLRQFNFSFSKLPTVVYTVDLMEFESPKPEPPRKVAAVVRKEPEKPKPKPQPKPEPKPEPKPPQKKAVVPPEKKNVEVPKVVKPPAPKTKPPEVKQKPEPPKKEEPPPEPEPVKEIAKVIEPEPEPVASSTVKLDTNFITPELRWYIEIIRRKVWQNWIEPRHALPPGTHARVVIRFEIGRDGRFVLDPEIFEHSNISPLDQSGYRAVLRSAPFPPLPEGYSGDTLGVRFGFGYGESA